MTADIELLPLPEHIEAGEFTFDAHVFEHTDMVSYARANVAHATEPLKAEIEALRAMLGECYVLAGADTDGDPPERHYRDAVRAVGDLRRDYDEALAEPDYKYRAERLAEALRLIAAPKRQDGTWNRDREACRQIAAEALRDHGQEGKDA